MVGREVGLVGFRKRQITQLVTFFLLFAGMFGLILNFCSSEAHFEIWEAGMRPKLEIEDGGIMAFYVFQTEVT